MVERVRKSDHKITTVQNRGYEMAGHLKHNTAPLHRQTYSSTPTQKDKPKVQQCTQSRPWHPMAMLQPGRLIEQEVWMENI